MFAVDPKVAAFLIKISRQFIYSVEGSTCENFYEFLEKNHHRLARKLEGKDDVADM